MGLFGIGRSGNETLPEKEKIIQLLSEITTILEDDGIQVEVDKEEKIFSQAEYDEMQQTLNKENEELKKEILQLKEEITSLQSREEPTPVVVEEQTTEIVVADELVVEQLKAINERVTELARKETVIQELHAELQKYKSGLKKDIITPILKSIIRCYDRVVEYRNIVLSTTAESAEPMLQHIEKSYSNLSLYITDMLYDYDIEIIEVSVGDNYEPKKHKVITTIDTDDESKHNTIAEIKKIGFEDVLLCRVLRHCEVIVYKSEEK